MPWLTRRIGLIIWALVWLAITLVPLWRLRATREWQTSSLQTIADTQLGLLSRLETQIARSFPKDVEAQLIALRVPLNQVSSHEVSSEQSFNSEFSRRASTYFARYDDLEHRFPGSNEVRAQRLRDVTRGYLNEHEGPPRTGDIHIYPKETRVTWLPELELEKSLQTAHAGAQYDPTNGFFPWMEAVLLFTMERPDEAIQALERAGKCTAWTDYTANTLLSRIELGRHVRTMGWEDEAYESYGFLVPHYAKMRSAARAATGQMRLARQRGDEARALQIAGILQRAGAVMAHGHDLLVTRLVGEAICSLAWQRTSEDVRPDFSSPLSGDSPEQRRQALEDRRTQLVQEFVAYTRAHGRGDLADEALSIEPTLRATRLSAFLTTPPYDEMTRYRLSLSSAFWMNFWLLHLAFAGSLVWALTALYTRHRHKAQPNNGSPNNGSVIVQAFFCVGATIVLFVVLAKQGPGREFVESFMGAEIEPTPLSLSFDLLQNYLLYVLGILWILPSVQVAFIRSSPSLEPNPTKPKMDWSRLPYLGLMCLPGALLLWVGAYSYSLVGSLESLSPLTTVLAVGVVVASASWVAWAPQNQMALRILTYSAWWVALLAFILTCVGKEDALYGQNLGLLALLLTIATCVVGSRCRRKAALQNFVQQLRLTSAVLALSATLGYAGVTLSSAPIEQRTHALLVRQFQIGESNYLSEQLRQSR